MILSNLNYAKAMKDHTEFNVIGLIRQANPELGTSDPAAFLIFLLVVTSRLRKEEIDLLEWLSFRFKDNSR